MKMLSGNIGPGKLRNGGRDIDGTEARPYCSIPLRKLESGAAGFSLEVMEGRTVGLLRKFWMLWAALGAIVLGFLTLSARMLTMGPILLVLGYCVLLPFFLWRSFQDSVGE